MRVLIAVALLMCGCATKMPKISPQNSYMHWSDTTIVQYHPEFALVCNSDGKVLGKIDSYGTTWYSSSSAGFEDAEYESESAAGDALISSAKASKTCPPLEQKP